MSPSAISIFVFGIYLALVGVGFIFIPNTVLPVFKFPKTNEPWVRILGIVIAALSFFYIIAALNELTVFFWASVIERFAILVSFVLLAVIKKTPLSLIMFGVVDAAGGVWTLLAMQ